MGRHKKYDEQVRLISLDKIKLPGFLVRDEMESSDDIIRLGKSIKKNGLIEPILLMENKDGLTLVVGWRRFHAHKAIGLPVIPAIVKQMSLETAVALRWEENDARRDISPLDEARFLDERLEIEKLTQEQLAEKIGRSKAYVSQRLGILTGYDFVRQGLKEEKIGFAIARELNQFKNKADAQYYMKFAVTSGATSDQLRRWRQESEAMPQAQEETLQPETIERNAQQQGNQFVCECCRHAFDLALINYMKLCGGCYGEAVKAMTAPVPEDTSETN